MDVMARDILLNHTLKSRVFLAAFMLFCISAVLVATGVLQEWDGMLLLTLRQGADPSQPRAPELITGAVLLLTAFGGQMVLVPVAVVAASLLVATRRRIEALVLTMASASGLLLNEGLKLLFARPRPDIVPHLLAMDGFSFPSGHAMLSVIVYGFLLHECWRMMGVPPRRRSLLNVMVAGLIMLIGMTRPYIGVHYMTDVLGGWGAGMMCLMLWNAVLELLRTAKDRDLGTA